MPVSYVISKSKDNRHLKLSAAEWRAVEALVEVLSDLQVNIAKTVSCLVNSMCCCLVFWP